LGQKLSRLSLENSGAPDTTIFKPIPLLMNSDASAGSGTGNPFGKVESPFPKADEVMSEEQKDGECSSPSYDNNTKTPSGYNNVSLHNLSSPLKPPDRNSLNIRKSLSMKDPD
jgi:hypothetical protein